MVKILNSAICPLALFSSVGEHIRFHAACNDSGEAQGHNDSIGTEKVAQDSLGKNNLPLLTSNLLKLVQSNGAVDQMLSEIDLSCLLHFCVPQV